MISLSIVHFYSEAPLIHLLLGITPHIPLFFLHHLHILFRLIYDFVLFAPVRDVFSSVIEFQFFYIFLQLIFPSDFRPFSRSLLHWSPVCYFPYSNTIRLQNITFSVKNITFRFHMIHDAQYSKAF